MSFLVCDICLDIIPCSWFLQASCPKVNDARSAMEKADVSAATISMVIQKLRFWEDALRPKAVHGLEGVLWKALHQHSRRGEEGTKAEFEEHVKLASEAAKHLGGKFQSLSVDAAKTLKRLEEQEDEKESKSIFDLFLRMEGEASEEEYQKLLRLLSRQPVLSDLGLAMLSEVLWAVAVAAVRTLAQMSDQGPVNKEQIAFQTSVVAGFIPYLPSLPGNVQTYHGEVTKIMEGLGRLLEAMSDVLQFAEAKAFLQDDKGGRRSNFLMRSVGEFQSLLDSLPDAGNDPGTEKTRKARTDLYVQV